MSDTAIVFEVSLYTESSVHGLQALTTRMDVDFAELAVTVTVDSLLQLHMNYWDPSSVATLYSLSSAVVMQGSDSKLEESRVTETMFSLLQLARGHDRVNLSTLLPSVILMVMLCG